MTSDDDERPQHGARAKDGESGWHALRRTAAAGERQWRFLHIEPSYSAVASRHVATFFSAMLLVACSAFAGAGARSPIQTAFIGLLLCPGLGHLYVLWSLLSHSSAKVSPRGARHRRIALVVSLVGIGAVAFFVVTK